MLDEGSTELESDYFMEKEQSECVVRDSESGKDNSCLTDNVMVMTESTESGCSSLTPLPPCKICRNKSSGFHYGAYTCEACKGFFRRTLKKKVVNFKCICSDDNKQKSVIQKSICPACRYRTCLAVGMSKNAIKIGRYSLTRKTENIREVKRLECSEDKSTLFPLSSNNSKGFNSPRCSLKPSLSNGAQISMTSDLYSMFSHESQVSKRSSSESKSGTTQLTRWPNSESYESLLADLIDATKTILAPLGNPNDAEDNLEKKLKYLQQYNEQCEVFGDLNSLSCEEFLDFYTHTGINLDNRFEILKEIIVFVENKIKDIVSFAKLIPGFNELPLQDRANLIKATRHEQDLITFHRCFDLDLEVVTPPWCDKVYHKKEIIKSTGVMAWEQRIIVVKKMREINIPMEIEAIMRAVILTAPDRTKLEESASIQGIQYKMLDCLEYVLHKRGQNQLLPRIMDIITEIRSVEQNCDLIKKGAIFDHPMFKEHKLFWEMLS